MGFLESLRSLFATGSGKKNPPNQRDWELCDSTDWEVAIPACTRLIESGALSSRDLASVYGKRGIAYACTGRFDQSEADLAEANRLEGKPPKPPRTGEDLFRDIHENRDAIAEHFNTRGNAYAKNGQYERAISEFNNALGLKPNLPGAFANRADSYVQMGEFDRAIADYNEAFRLMPNFKQIARLRLSPKR
jgi:tetratricopeptide (TPR) repeat protein